MMALLFPDPMTAALMSDIERMASDAVPMKERATRIAALTVEIEQLASRGSPGRRRHRQRRGRAAFALGTAAGRVAGSESLRRRGVRAPPSSGVHLPLRPSVSAEAPDQSAGVRSPFNSGQRHRRELLHPPLVTNDAAVAPALESVQDQAKFGFRDYRIGRCGGIRKRRFL
jgi:hypothetical protein